MSTSVSAYRLGYEILTYKGNETSATVWDAVRFRTGDPWLVDLERDDGGVHAPSELSPEDEAFLYGRDGTFGVGGVEHTDPVGSVGGTPVSGPLSATHKWLNAVAAQFDGNKYDEENYAINFISPDNNEVYKITIANGTMTVEKGAQHAAPGLTITIDQHDLAPVMMGYESFDDQVNAGLASYTGDEDIYSDWKDIVNNVELSNDAIFSGLNQQSVADSVDQWLAAVESEFNPLQWLTSSFTINLINPDSGVEHTISVHMGSLSIEEGTTSPTADLTLTINQSELSVVMLGYKDFNDRVNKGIATVEGDSDVYSDWKDLIKDVTVSNETVFGSG